jgi:hypothetical protein
MKRFLVPALLVVALLFSFAAAPAEATSITLVKSTFKNLGAGDSTDTEQVKPWEFVVTHDFGSFNSAFIDKYKFTIADLETLGLKITTWGHVLQMNIDILDSTGHSVLPALISFTDLNGPTVNVLTFTDALLATMLLSPYLVLKVTGAFCACAGYSIAVFPLPPAAIMFLTALLGMGGLAWRRRQTAGAAQAA